MSLPPGILDPAGPFEKCEVCGYDIDYTKQYDHRECVPKIQNIGWWICETCNRYPWDCECPQEAECVDCEVSVTDIDGPKCEESPTGYHRWKVTDGDSWRYLFDSVGGVTVRQLRGGRSRCHLGPSGDCDRSPEITVPHDQATDDEALPY